MIFDFFIKRLSNRGRGGIVDPDILLTSNCLDISFLINYEQWVQEFFQVHFFLQFFFQVRRFFLVRFLVLWSCMIVGTRDFLRYVFFLQEFFPPYIEVVWAWVYRRFFPSVFQYIEVLWTLVYMDFSGTFIFLEELFPHTSMWI